MYKIGEFNENKAREIADCLKDAGMKVDLRTVVSCRFEIYEFLEGRLSELKDVVEDFEGYEGYVNSLKQVLSSGVDEESFWEKLQLELDPEVNEKRSLIRSIFEGGFSEEEHEAEKANFARFMTDLDRVALAESYIGSIMELNKIQIGSDIGDRLNDPIVRIPIDLDDYGEDRRLVRKKAVLSYVPVTEVYIDEFSAALSEEIDEEFQEEYPEEALQIASWECWCPI